MSRFVTPEVVTLKISHGDTLTVKRRLNSGEQRAMYARMYLAGVDGRLRADTFKTGVAIITAYLVDWSIVDDAGTVVPIREKSVDEVTSVLDSLDQDSFLEIKQAIEAHENAIAAERDAAKKSQDGANNESAISPSPSGAAGALTGSAS